MVLKIQMIINDKVVTLHEFSNKELHICNMEMSGVSTLDTSLGHPLAHWIANGGIESIVNKPKNIADRLLMLADSKGWLEKSLLYIKGIQSVDLALEIIKLDEYKKERMIDFSEEDAITKN